jgi:hypothetical protein
MGLVGVPEGRVVWDIQVIMAEEVGIIRNDMDRAVGSLAVSYSSLTSQPHWVGALAQSAVWQIEVTVKWRRIARIIHWQWVGSSLTRPVTLWQRLFRSQMHGQIDW